MTTFYIITGAAFWVCVGFYLWLRFNAWCNGRPWTKRKPRNGGNRYEAR